MQGSWRLMVSLTIAACTSSPRRALTPIAPPLAVELDGGPYAATVGRDEARFVFAPVRQDEFEWWSPAQRQQLTTYRWDVLVRALSDTAYSVGYWLPAVGFETYGSWYEERRPVPEGTQRGSLAELLRAGMHDVRLLQDHVAVPVPGMEAQVRAEGAHVVLEVHGARAIRRLFSLRPSHVTFYTYLPGEPPRIAHVPVRYEDR